MGICVLIGGEHTLDEHQMDEGPPGGLLKLLVKPELLDSTYRDFLGECKEYINTDFHDSEVRATYARLQDALQSGNDAHDFYSVCLLNRKTGESGQYSLEEDVRETAASYMYAMTHQVDARATEFKTIELYLIKQENGG